VNSLGPDVTAHFFMEDPYAEALRKNAINHTLSGQLASPLAEPSSHLSMGATAGTHSSLLEPQLLGPLADASLLLAYQTGNGPCSSIASDSINKPPAFQVPPMPPLRSTAHLLQDDSTNQQILFDHRSSNPFSTYSRASLASPPTHSTLTSPNGLGHLV
jgi:hypothetical protein